jgi:hypothetical protein
MHSGASSLETKFPILFHLSFFKAQELQPFFSQDVCYLSSDSISIRYNRGKEQFTRSMKAIILLSSLTDKTRMPSPQTPLPERARGFENLQLFLAPLLPQEEKGLGDEGKRFVSQSVLLS